MDLPSSNTPLAKYGTVFTNAKAGMQNVDKEHVKRIVYEMSKDSPHFKNEQRKQAQTEERIRKMQVQAKALSAGEVAHHTSAMDAKILALEATRDLTRTWLHVDMDAFFASVEELADPSLKDKPMAVGGLGMISTANYVARKYGVRSAMPGKLWFIGRRLCPELVFAKPDFQKYSKAAQETRAVFRRYDPEFQAGSLDEAYMDVTDYCQQHGVSGAWVASEIRRQVQQETGLTCSVGQGPNTLISKVASDMNKPNGQFVVENDGQAVARFIQELPIRKVPGIGRVTEELLKSLGVEKCSDLINKRGMLAALFSPLAMESFLSAGLGLGRTLHSEPAKEGEVTRKGISCERTFAAISSREDLEAKCSELAHKLADEMADESLKARTLTLKLKATTFEVRTRAQTLPQPVWAAEDILQAALKLLAAEMPIEIRLMGIRMSHFVEVGACMQSRC
eukprot:jgi/Astpho2/5434/e_gw1.00076.4.1_t